MRWSTAVVLLATILPLAAAYALARARSGDVGSTAGRGWIVSPAGALAARPDIAGRASFAFRASERPDGRPPTGRATFELPAAGLRFTTTEHAWLVVAGNRATFRGRGTINGAGDYGLLVTAIDGDADGAGLPDRIRVRIADWSSELLVYDNQPGASLASDAAAVLGGGSIRVARTDAP